MQLPQCGKCHIIDRCLKHCQLQQTKPTTFLPPLYTALLCYKYSTASVTEKQASFIFATFTNSQITQMSRKSRPATFLLLLPVLKFYHPTTDRDWTQPRRQYQILIRCCIWSKITTNTHPAIELQSFEPQSIIEQIWHCLKQKIQMKVILGKDKWWWGSRCLTARWCFVGIWGKFLSLSPPHYIIGTPFNLTQMLIHWNLLLLHTGLNLTDINYSTLQCAVL